MWLLIAGLYKGTPNWLKIAFLLLVAAVAIYGAGYIRGGSNARAACETQAQRAIVAAGAQDMQANNDIRGSELETIDVLKKQKAIDDAKIVDLKNQLRNPSPTPCVYDEHNSDAAPARRMRH